MGFEYKGAGFYQIAGGGRAWVGCNLAENGFEGDVCLMGFLLHDVTKNVGWRLNGSYLNYPNGMGCSNNLLGKIHE